MPVAPARLDVRGLNKTFGPVQVLADVTLSVLAGEVHGLAGQNGSGKSTLIKILTGVYSPDPGATCSVDGRPIRLPVRWRDVRAAGVTVVHQDLGLLDQLTVAENICIGGFPTTLGRIDAAARDRLAATTLARLGVGMDPRALVRDLTAPERAEVAIARAMRDHAEGEGLVILDEATRALTGADLDRVHALLRRITAQGSSALLISHNLSELMTVADRVTVLRDGRVVGASASTGDLTGEEIARRMLGATLVVDAAPTAATRPGVPAASVTGLRGRRLVQVDFDVDHGEVLGITGLPGSGYEDIPYLMTGAQSAVSGTLTVDGHVLDLSRAGVRGCMRAGVVLVPERRDRDGLAFEISMRDNIALPKVRKQGRFLFVSRRWQQEDTDAAVRDLGIRPADPAMLIKQFSGGNQQKVLLGKWLAVGPEVLVLHEPTQAVDVGARRDILRTLRRAATSGMAVVVVSSEPEDLAAVCDRVLVYHSDGGLRTAVSTGADDLIDQIYASDATRTSTGPTADAAATREVPT